MNLTDAKNKRPPEQISSQVMDLNLEFPHKFHASNHFSTRCMMDYHGLKSFNNFQHLIFTVSEALKSTANNRLREGICSQSGDHRLKILQVAVPTYRRIDSIRWKNRSMSRCVCEDQKSLRFTLYFGFD